ncbi:TM2 domain-containing protein [Deinococcus gobiensis]|uniref:TM2 domain-containing membrane protein n=2 Tax=Deinococcus TaxID=1298 RepID=H8GTV5_DEIGI|nr:TM2 domain-containing protein [Deinococcus gobiensis]AFD26595.1 TM2 domain-containing membrane protein [Deinococcus gobiensis I-0]
MTKRDDPSGNPDLTPQGNAPSWVDEVLGASASPAPARPAGPDLSKERPAPPPPPRPPLEGPENLRIPEPERPARPDDFSSDDWIGRMTGGAARSSGPAPTGRPYAEPTHAEPMRSDWAQGAPRDAWGDQRPAMPYAGGLAGGDVAQRKLIAGLLAIFLGSLGVHKFYLGMNRPGALMLGLNVGVWVLAILLGIITLAVGFIVTLPLASLVSFVLGVLGLVEGIIYLTKSDEAFARDYLVGKKAWL